MAQKRRLSMTFFIINDIIILIINFAILILSFLLSIKENDYRDAINLFLFQLITSTLNVTINLIMNTKNIISKYKGHNNYGMFVRFLLFYLILSCIILSYQRSQNINHKEINDLGKIILFIGFTNEIFIISSMILSFIVVDKKNYTQKKKYEKEFNIESVQQMTLFENDSDSGKVMTELAKRKD